MIDQDTYPFPMVSDEQRQGICVDCFEHFEKKSFKHCRCKECAEKMNIADKEKYDAYIKRHGDKMDESFLQWQQKEGD